MMRESEASGANGAATKGQETPASDEVDATAVLNSVPGYEDHEKAPCPVEQIAWQYLAPDKRMRRWTETIEIHDLGSARREIVLDFTLPDLPKQPWMLPTAYLGKSPVAPDLEVRDAAAAAVSVPTKPENMAITAAALDELAAAGLISFADPQLRALCRQVIFATNFEARVARLLAEERLGPEDDLLRSLLRALEDQFLLWVPVDGEPGCDQQVSIHRRQGLARNVFLVPTRVAEERSVSTAIGPVRVELFGATGRRRPSIDAATSRVLRRFGLTPYEYEHETTEAARFASFHLRVSAPQGMVVRDVGMRVAPEGTEQDDPPRLTEAPVSEPGLTYRGREGSLAHFHFARDKNPPVLTAFTTLSIRSGLTSLWAGASVFTALLLWAIHRLAPDDLALASSGSLEATVAILLIGPVVAAAWAIRADRGDLLETTLDGARACLLASAVLSVATALSLAGFRPFHWSNATAIEVYASLSYGAAALIVVGWVVALRLCWVFYREILTTARRNYVALFLLAALAAAVCIHGDLPIRLVGLTLLATGLLMAVLAAHPGRAIGAPNVGPVAAAIGSFVTLVIAGWYLGFYDNLASRHALHLAVLASEGVLMVFAAVQWYRRG